jgi:hypothetical protein
MYAVYCGLCEVSLNILAETRGRDLLLFAFLVQVGLGGSRVAVGNRCLLSCLGTLLGLGGQFLGSLGFLLRELYLTLLCGLLCGVGVLLGFESGLAGFLWGRIEKTLSNSGNDESSGCLFQRVRHRAGFFNQLGLGKALTRAFFSASSAPGVLVGFHFLQSSMFMYLSVVAGIEQAGRCQSRE